MATEKELQSAPHVTPEVAKAIVAGRPYASVSALDAVLAKSLKREQIREAYGRVFVPVNLNTASDEDILLIPGVGKRMLHEFLEYRPYKSLEQFRREIGKYVDKRSSRASRIRDVQSPGPRRRDPEHPRGRGCWEFKEYRPYKSRAVPPRARQIRWSATLRAATSGGGRGGGSCLRRGRARRPSGCP